MRAIDAASIYGTREMLEFVLRAYPATCVHTGQNGVRFAARVVCWPVQRAFARNTLACVTAVARQVSL